MIGRRIGRFHIVSKLGEGGMASVWKAEDSLLGRPVALKILADDLARSPGARRRFLREARVAASLDHPGIAAMYAAGEEDDTIYIAFYYVDGMTLGERISRAPLAWQEASEIVAAAAQALAYAHARGVVHRDITSRNIMLARDGRVFVLDFGLAIAAGITRITSSSTTLGTAAYLSPEAARGEPADARSDIYGLGVVFYEALTGVLPFRAPRPEAVLYSIVHEDPRSPRALRANIPRCVERVVMRALAKRAVDRHPTVENFLADLDSARSEGALGAEAASGANREMVRDAVRAEPGGAGPLPEHMYLLVLPFEDAGTTEADRERREDFGNGLAEAVSASLAGLPGVIVIPPPATIQRARTAGLEGIARQQGANLILCGTVRHAGVQLRISYSLMDPYRGVQLAGGVLDGTKTALFDLENRLVSEVRSALGYDKHDARPGDARRPRDPAAHERYVQALGYLRRYENEASVDGAIALLERLLDTEGDSVLVQAALGRSYLYKYRLTREHMWEMKAAAACERAVVLDPLAPDVLVTLGDVHLAAGRHEDGVRDYRRALELRRDLPEAYLGLAQACEALGCEAEATAACTEAVARWPNDWRCYSRLGLLYYNRGQFAQAVEPWRILVRIAPDNTRGYLHLGAAYYQLDRLEEAIEAYRRSIELQPTASAFTSLGSVLYYLGRHAEAVEALKKGALLRPSDPQVWGHLGSAFRWMPAMEREAAEALDRAIGLMRDRLARNPREAEDWALMGSWLADRGRPVEAREAAEKALALAPHNARFMALVGITYENIGCRDRAVELLRGAVRAGHPGSHLMRDPTLAALRADPVFQSILAEAPALAGGVQAQRHSRGGSR